MNSVIDVIISTLSLGTALYRPTIMDRRPWVGKGLDR